MGFYEDLERLGNFWNFRKIWLILGRDSSARGRATGGSSTGLPRGHVIDLGFVHGAQISGVIEIRIPLPGFAALQGGGARASPLHRRYRPGLYFRGPGSHHQHGFVEHDPAG